MRWSLWWSYDDHDDVCMTCAKRGNRRTWLVVRHKNWINRTLVQWKCLGIYEKLVGAGGKRGDGRPLPTGFSRRFEPGVPRCSPGHLAIWASMGPSCRCSPSRISQNLSSPLTLLWFSLLSSHHTSVSIYPYCTAPWPQWYVGRTALLPPPQLRAPQPVAMAAPCILVASANGFRCHSFWLYLSLLPALAPARFTTCALRASRALAQGQRPWPVLLILVLYLSTLRTRVG